MDHLPGHLGPKADPVDGKTSKYTNTVTSHPTAEFMEFIKANGQTFDEAATARQAASSDHCRRETPLYAAGIGRHANPQEVTAR